MATIITPKPPVFPTGSPSSGMRAADFTIGQKVKSLIHHPPESTHGYVIGFADNGHSFVSVRWIGSGNVSECYPFHLEPAENGLETILRVSP